jgi:hypothetical protein
VIRFQIAPAANPGSVTADPATPDTTSPQAYGDDVTASTVYFRPQSVNDGRTCGTELGIGAEQPWPG